MRILILAHFYPPEMGGAAARLHGLARWLAHDGHDVTVITGFPNYPSGVIPAAYRRKFRVQETMDGVTVLRAWVYASPRRSAARRLANYISFVFSSAMVGLLAGRSYDIVLASSPPLFLGLSGLFLARLRRCPLVLDIRDLWPEVAVEAGEFAPDGLVTRLAQRLARFLYRHADHITPVTENKRKKLLAVGVPIGKTAVVTNGVDLDYVAAAKPGDKRAELGLEDKFVILYAGLIGIAQGVEIAIHAANCLRDDETIHFVIVGDGPRRDSLRQQVESLGLKNVTLIPRQPRAEIPLFLRTADVALVPLVSSNLDDAVPSKLLEAWAYGRPVILAAGGEAATIVQHSAGGLVVSPEEPDNLTDAILALKNDPDQLAQYAQNGRAYVQAHFDRRALAGQMGQVLERTLHSG